MVVNMFDSSIWEMNDESTSATYITLFCFVLYLKVIKIPKMSLLSGMKNQYDCATNKNVIPDTGSWHKVLYLHCYVCTDIV